MASCHSPLDFFMVLPAKIGRLTGFRAVSQGRRV
jgi:hypothetical protein